MRASTAMHFAALTMFVPFRSQANCPPGTLVGRYGQCYKVQFVAEYWIKAATNCVEFGGNLASVSEKDSNKLLARFTQDSVDDDASAFWLGAFVVNKTWHWKDNVLFNYTNWASGEPRYTEEHAVAYMSGDSGLWYSAPASTKLPYICEVPPVDALRGPPCPVSTVTGLSNECYLLKFQPQSWLEAERWCLKSGAPMVSVHNQSTNTFLTFMLIGTKYVRYWLGATNTVGPWSWSDGTPFNYKNWASPAMPSNSESASLLNVNSHGLWESKYAYSDVDPNPYICQLTIELPKISTPTTTSRTSTTTATLSAKTLTSSATSAKPTTSLLATSNMTRSTPRSRMPTSASTNSSTTYESFHGTTRGPYVQLHAPGMNAAVKTIVITVSTAASTTFAFVGVFCLCRKWRLSRKNRRITRMQNQYNPWVCPPSGNSAITRRLISFLDLHISKETVGSGAFATVYKGTLRRRTKFDEFGTQRATAQSTLIPVACKVLHQCNAEKYRGDVMREIDLMYAIGQNPHILRLIGHTFLNDDPILVLQYCSKGDLLSFLRHNLKGHKDAVSSAKEFLQHRPYVNTKLTLVDLIAFSWQVSDGMTFLSGKGLIHRDLAARNILLSSELVAKIADFGLCRPTKDECYSSLRDVKLPIKWTAPEALSEAQFSTKSDVWSYGVLLYEIFSAGGTPYENVYPMELLRFLNEGHRMEQPALCPSDIYRLMGKCWQLQPSERPSFENIRRYFAKCLEYLSKGYGYITLSDLSQHYV